MGIGINYDYDCNCGVPWCECAPDAYLNRIDVLALNLETAAAMEITRQTYYRRGWENAMAIKGICEPLEEEHAERILSLQGR